MKKIISLCLCTLAALLLLASCGEKDSYKIAVDASYEPFLYIDSLGNAVGFEADIMNAIAETEGFEVEYISVGYPDALEILEDGKVDAALASVIPTDELRQKFDFTDMYYNNEYAVAVKKGKNEDLIEKFNDGLAKIKENGKYDELYSVYFADK